jgi:cyanophycin synthetase
MGAAEIPATFGGLALFNVANALAAVAMAYAAASRLRPSAPPCRVLLDLRAEPRPPQHGSTRMASGSSWITLTILRSSQRLCDLVAQLRPRHRRTIGLVSCPATGATRDLREMGRIGAGAFDEIVLRERPETRGGPMAR